MFSKNYIKFGILTIFFTVIIYYLNYNFFFLEKKENKKIETLYIDPKKENIINLKKQEEILSKKEKEQLKKFYKNKKTYEIFYFPKTLENKIFTKNLKTLLENKIFKDKIDNLIINIYIEKKDIRGNMKNRYIRLYGLESNKINEFYSVFIHELGHFIDLYFLKKRIFLDISNKFYNISWITTKKKKKGQNQNDFISGYAMTNKYEDFAESFNFYILHNKEFLYKTKKSKILKNKYNFFSSYLFKHKEFFATDFSIIKPKNYYWDTTKVPYSKKKFLLYLRKVGKTN